MASTPFPHTYIRIRTSPKRKQVQVVTSSHRFGSKSQEGELTRRSCSELHLKNRDYSLFNQALEGARLSTNHSLGGQVLFRQHSSLIANYRLDMTNLLFLLKSLIPSDLNNSLTRQSGSEPVCYRFDVTGYAPTSTSFVKSNQATTLVQRQRAERTYPHETTK